MFDLNNITKANYKNITKNMVINYLNDRNNLPKEWMTLFTSTKGVNTIEEFIHLSIRTHNETKNKEPTINESNLMNIIPKIFQQNVISNVKVNKKPSPLNYYNRNKWRLLKKDPEEIIEEFYRNKILPTTFRYENCKIAFKDIKTKQDEFVLDFSGGYGDRLLYCILNDINIVIIDPNPYVHNGYKNMIEIMSEILNKNIPKIKLLAKGAEDYDFSDNIIMVFTSPPYYDFEIYTNQPGQCYDNKSYDDWLNNWLIKLCLSVKTRNIPLKLSISNIPKYNIEDDLLRIMKNWNYPCINTDYIPLLYNKKKFKKIHTF